MNDARQFRRSIPVIEYKLQVLQYLTAESIALETAVNFLFVLRRERGDPTQRTVTNYLGGGELAMFLAPLFRREILSFRFG